MSLSAPTTATKTARQAEDRPFLTRKQHIALGKAARATAPRSSQADFAPAPNRPDPLALLESQAAARVPELLPIRYGRMAASAFSYFRGAALPMASDLARTPRTGLMVQACGDAHMSNFGLFASPERRLVFDINDFDETLPGPWEWDVKRLAASLEIAARDNGYTRQEGRTIVLAAVAAYRHAMRTFADQTALEIWYAHADVESVRARYGPQFNKKRRKTFDRTVGKAETKDNLGALGRFAGTKGGQPRIMAVPPLIVPIDELDIDGMDPADLRRQLLGLLNEYRSSLPPERRALLDRYRFVDMARKVVGVGSVGTRSWMVLLLGEDEHDPLFLQAKEAGPSVLEEFVGRSEFDNAGERVVVGQRLMQASSDIFLGWVRRMVGDGQTRDFYVRQLRDWKGSADVAVMDPGGMGVYGELCGWTLARAHARTGDPIALASYLGRGPAFDEAIGEFAQTYADQNERDHQALVEAIKTGRIVAASEV